MKALVSIITPVYNGESYIHRLLDSVLAQTYPCIEMIVIDDGSTDSTISVLESYKSRFDDRGYIFKYFTQENAGQATALNRGLLVYTGDYLTWPDSDDFYSSKEAIERVVSVLDDTTDTVGMLRTYGTLLDEETLEIVSEFKSETANNNLFYNCILEEDFYFANGCYFSKAKVVKKVLKENQIYESRGGQNWQMYIPIMYQHECVTLPEYMFSVMARSGSHSRSTEDDLTQQLDKLMGHEDIIINTLYRLKDIDEVDRNHLVQLVENKYAKKRLTLFFDKRSKSQFLDQYKKMRGKSILSNKDIIKSFLVRIPYFEKWGSILARK